ncbi:MAG: FKBP-type peptidyl-prolyl cis-trans isomerase [bacterium]
MRYVRVLGALALFALPACGGTVTAEPTAVNIETTAFAPALGVNLAASTKTADGLYVRDATPGTGQALAAGQTVELYYVGYLPDGTLFDQKQTGIPVSIKLGSGQAIGGWDKGLVGMKIGGARQVVVPPALGYGAAGHGPFAGNSIPVPGNAVLIYSLYPVGVQ